MNKIWNALCSLGRWMRRNFDFALILAALVEIPRWTVTFLAIHEPLWVGIPLGALLAYATSEGWRAYFADTRRTRLLWFNIASLASATFVITPVLFSMASAPIDEIDLAALLPFGWLLGWSAVLAVTTFAPLIQIAAVKSTPKGTSTETPTANGTVQDSKNKAPAPPAQSGGHSEAASATPAPAEQTGAMSAQPEGGAKPTKEQRRALIAEWQLQSSKQVMESFNVGKRTADEDMAWVRKNIMHANGVTK